MKTFVTILLVTCALLTVGQKLPDDVEVSIKKRIEYRQNPSIAVGIIDKNGSRYFNFGAKTFDGALVDEHTIYEIGSISKTFTAILLAQQAASDKLKLEDPIKKFLSDVKVPSEEQPRLRWVISPITLQVCQVNFNVTDGKVASMTLLQMGCQ